MHHRKLRIAFSAVCGILCLLLMVLWIRSYLYWDLVSKTTTEGEYLSFVTGYGTLSVIKSTEPTFLTHSAGWDIEHKVLDGEPAMEFP